MANSVNAIQNGLYFQEGIFWLQAAKMLDKENKITSVTWEDDGVLGFDDVVVEYQEGILDEDSGVVVFKDFIQVKHHMDRSQMFSVNSFIDPAFIGATSVSLLQKLQKQYSKQLSNGKAARYILVNTWGFDVSDVIGKLIGVGGALRLDILFDNTTDRSQMGKVRKLWREHLELNSEEELKTILKSLRIRTNYPDLHTITETLNPSLKLAGLLSFPVDKLQNKYYTIVPRLHGQKQNRFTPESLMEICKREGLLLPTDIDMPYKIGIRSFMRGAENLEKETQEMLCLAHLYEERTIRDHKEWFETALPSISHFVAAVAAKQKKIELTFHTHLSLAFATGYCLEPKLGKSVSVLQTTQNTQMVWSPLFKTVYNNDELFFWEDFFLRDDSKETAIAISLTHEIQEDVKAYVLSELPNVGRVFHAKVLPSPSYQALKDGDHVVALAQAVSFKIANSRTIKERFGKVHVFLAGPVAFAFFLGQYSKSLGSLELYELANFPALKLGDYKSVLTFPF